MVNATHSTKIANLEKLTTRALQFESLRRERTKWSLV